METKKRQRRVPDDLLQCCLSAFLVAGTLDLSLDQLSAKVGVSKRMLIHYFGSRDTLEIRAIELLEDRLRASFSPAAFPPGTSAKSVIDAIWEQSTAPSARGTLQVIMDISRRGWSGSERARAFYADQQRMWLNLLQSYLPCAADAEELLQLFQGAILVYLVTEDREQGTRTLRRFMRRM